MNAVHLGAFDLNLLVALDALLVERNVTKAAARIGVTQSAASHALARLRVLIGDPILVRSRDGMVPTPRAEAMRARLRRTLEQLAQTIAPAGKFEPKLAALRVFIGTSDYAEIVLLPRLMARLSRDAPGIELRVISLGGGAISELATGGLDFLVMPDVVPISAPGTRRQRLFTDRFVCMTRRNHPFAKKKRVPVSDFADARHALVSPWGKEGGSVDDALAKLGLRRHTAIAVPHFLAAPHIIASTDLVLTLAERVATVIAKSLDLVPFPPPRELGLASFANLLYWHDRTHDDPARRWLRETIVEEARALAGERATRSPSAKRGALERR